MKNYVILDIENPNARGNSICAIGLIIVQNGKISERKYSLINPEDRFDRMNSEITGLTESMVLDAPALPECWKEIEAVICENTIVGHNIRYDLSVLSKALERYDLAVPEFHYICTLKLSQSLINSDSYKLGKLVNDIGYTYQEHNALEDAEAAFRLFEHIVGNCNVDSITPETYRHEHVLKNKLDEKLFSNINDLYGIIEGINYDGVVDSKEIEYLKKWVNDNLKYREYALFDRIITTLNVILEDNIVTDYERRVLLSLVDSINHSKIYNDATLSIQILQGILKGIVCNEEIRVSEIGNLQIWLEENDYLNGVYPYDKIYNIVSKTMEDGYLSEEEKQQLFHEFDEVLHPVQCCKGLDLKDKTFCLTGDFKSGTKKQIEDKIIAKGGIKKTGVSAKLDYLFVGGLGSEAWKYGNIGGKIAKAQELQQKGKGIQIISEDDLTACL